MADVEFNTQSGYDFLQGSQSLIEANGIDVSIKVNYSVNSPPTPTLSSGTYLAGNGASIAFITVTWSPIYTSSDYIVRYKKSADTNYTYQRAWTSPHVILPLDAATSYDIGLASQDKSSGARSTFSANASTTTASDTTAPGTPTASGQKLVAGWILLTMTFSSGPEIGPADLGHFQIYRSTSANPYPASPQAKAYGNQWNDTGLVGGTTYHYQVTAVDVNGNASGATTDFSVTA